MHVLRTMKGENVSVYSSDKGNTSFEDVRMTIGHIFHACVCNTDEWISI